MRIDRRDDGAKKRKRFARNLIPIGRNVALGRQTRRASTCTQVRERARERNARAPYYFPSMCRRCRRQGTRSRTHNFSIYRSYRSSGNYPSHTWRPPTIILVDLREGDDDIDDDLFVEKTIREVLEESDVYACVCTSRHTGDNCNTIVN